MNVPFVNYPLQHQKYQKEIEDAILGVARSRARILQSEVKKFEEGLAQFIGTEHAVGLNSGTDALFLTLKLMGVGPGDEVITVGHTFHATVEAIKWNGATPVLVDVGADGMMDVEAVKKAITEKTVAIVPVHLMGDMVNMDKLSSETQIPILEDACQALGSALGGTKAGAWGLAGAFSFFPAKILGAYGDAGALTTDDEGLAKELKDMREHYKYNPGKWGFNSRLDEIQAAILNVKLKYLPDMIRHRQHIANIYDVELVGLEWLTLPTQRAGRVYQDYIVRCKDRNGLSAYLKEHDIETLKNDYHFPDDLPKPEATIELEQTTLRIPCNDVLTDEEVLYVAKTIRNYQG